MRLLNFDAPPLGLDLDGTLDDAVALLHPLSYLWPGPVCIITYRDDRQMAVQRLGELGIRYDELYLVGSFKEKADVIKNRGIKIYIDDMDEVLTHVPEDVTVLKVRNGGNYDYDSKKWVYDNSTGRIV